MRAIARDYSKTPQVRDLAKRITVRCRAKDYVCEARSLLHWVQREIKYQRDVLDAETLQTPDKTVADGSGDCDDKCILLAAMLLSIGHPARFVALAFRPGDFSHVIVETPVGAYWRGCETTESVPLGWRPPNVTRHMVQKV